MSDVALPVASEGCVNRERDKRGDTDGASGRVDAVAEWCCTCVHQFVQVARAAAKNTATETIRTTRATKKTYGRRFEGFKINCFLVGVYLLTTLCTSLSGTGMVIVPVPPHVIQSKESPSTCAAGRTTQDDARRAAVGCNARALPRGGRGELDHHE